MAMIGPTMSARLASFFPVGNTPAVDVLQSIPPNVDADVLLLGCGDARNVLFSLWSRSESDSGKYDFTCCDFSAEVIARNTLIYTLFLDDVDGTSGPQIWNVYYHFMLDNDSLALLQSQAKKLANLAASTAAWRRGPYGEIIRFCDVVTFELVVKLWRWYGLDASQPAAFKKQQERLKSTFDFAQRRYQKQAAGTYNGGSYRAASPCSEPHVHASFNLSRDYWNTGTATNMDKAVAPSSNFNPSFSTEHDDLVLDHGTEPLLSFHLATAYAPLSKDSPLYLESSQQTPINDPVRAAMAEFHAWTECLRNVQGRLTLRFTTSDAMAFCYALKCHWTLLDDRSAFLYRDEWHHVPLVLAQQEYSDPSGAPVAFDVIDTSNLVDHCGALNLLTACRPILKSGGASTIYMELLALRDQSLHAYAEGLLCGDMTTVLMILGLVSVQHWTSTTSFSPSLETLAERLAESTGIGQARFIVVWKNATITGTKCDSGELATFFYKLYLTMFEHENLAVQLSKTSCQLARKPYPCYTRAGFALLLGLVKDAQVVNFDSFITQLCHLVTHDKVLDLGSRYLDSFLLHLHESSLFPQSLMNDTLAIAQGVSYAPFKQWTAIPTALCLNVLVNPLSLDKFKTASMPRLLGYQIFQVSLFHLRSSRRRSFPDVQIGFGDVRTRGSRFTEEYAVQIDTDVETWCGDKPMLVSVLVPTKLLLEAGGGFESTVVVVELMPTVKAALTARVTPGPDPLSLLELCVLTLESDEIFITKNLPNLISRGSPPPAIPEISATGMTSAGTVSYNMILNEEKSKVERLNVHVDVSSTAGEVPLQSNEAVDFKILSPFILELAIGSGFRQKIKLPIALDNSAPRIIIAQTSSYVEFIANLDVPAWFIQKAGSVYPMFMHQGIPSLLNLSYTSPDKLPIIDLKDTNKLQFILRHLDSMYSEREGRMANSYPHIMMQTPNIRVNFKRDLSRICIIFAGLNNKPKQSIFAITPQKDKRASMYLFIYSLRLDLANLGIMLDGAMLPSVSTLVQRIGDDRAVDLLDAMAYQGGPVFEADESTLELWQHAGAAYAERCRDWEHSKACEYATHDTPDLLTTNDEGNMVCSCGLGKFPKGYHPDIPVWKDIAKHCVRVAISPFFYNPLVESEIKETGDLKLGGKLCWGCQKKPAGSEKLLACGGCGVAKYCSKECQTKDWKHHGHKRECKGLKKSS